MQLLDEKINIFLATTFGSLITSLFLKVDSYEHNHLINLNNFSSKLTLSYDSYKKLNLSKGSWFNYIQNQNPFSQKIINIKTFGDKYVLTLSGNTDITPITNISYKLEKTPILKKFFNL